MSETTVMTLNVLHSRACRLERARLAAAGVNDVGAGVLLLQEVPFTDEGTSAYLDVLAEETGLQVAFARPLAWHPDSGAYGLAVLYADRKLTLADAGVVPDLGGTEKYRGQASWAVFTDRAGRSLAVINVHGVWGGPLVRQREIQMVAIEHFAAQLQASLDGTDPVVVMGGDLNTEPESSPIRYLTGLQPIGEEGAYWVDAWVAAGDGTPGYTSTSDSVWFHQTARSVGITNPEAVPGRRIDYLFVRGWAYGRRGYPVSARLALDRPDTDRLHASDHFALLAQLNTFAPERTERSALPSVQPAPARQPATV